MWWRRLTDRALYSHGTVKRRGKKDGRDWRWTFWPFRESKESTPPVDQETPADFELRLKDVAQDDLASIANDWQDEDEELRDEYCDALTELAQARQAFRRASSEKSEARKAFERAKNDYFDFNLPTMSRRWTLFWLSLIGVGEFFLNSTVFQVLGTGRWETYLAALAVGVAIPILGHWTGEALRQDEKTRGDWILISATPVALFAGFYGLTYLRGRFAEARGLEMQRVLGIQLSSEEFMWVFFSLNVLLFFVAVVLSFAGSHRHASRFKRARKKYQAAKKRLKKESEEASAAAERLERAEKDYQRARIRREKRYQNYRQDARDVQATAEVLTRIYRDENVRARPDGRPKCFDRDVPAASVELPETLKDDELRDWECPGAPAEFEEVTEQIRNSSEGASLEERA